MRILIHSAAPDVPSGYGIQCRLLISQLQRLGHEVAVSAFYGKASAFTNKLGVPVFEAGAANYGAGSLAGFARVYEADLVITLMDFYKLAPVCSQLAKHKFRLAPWIPADCSPLSKLDEAALKLSGGSPIAMTGWGKKRLEAAGFSNVPVIPHCVNTGVFKEAARRSGRFTIGINAANDDAVRKAFPEQLQAFARFARRHDDALLMLHASSNTPSGWNLAELASDMSIGKDQVILSSRHIDGMTAWYQKLDVLSLCSYGEGFGVPLIEAQACGVPVIVTAGTAAEELCGAGWTVTGSRWWHGVHRAWWVRPNPESILAAYEKAYEARDWDPDIARRAREFATCFDIRRVADECWKPYLDLHGMH